MIDGVTFTHQGWMGIVPVILADPDGMCVVDVRYEWMNWILDSQIAIHQALTTLGMALFPYWEPAGFRIKLTGQLSKPIFRKAVDD